MSAQADSLRQFMARRPMQRARHTHVTVVASGKGGTGTSTVAAVLAAAAARAGVATLLVDAQNTPGSLALLLGADADTGGSDVFVPVAPRLHLLASHADVSGTDRRLLQRRASAQYEDFECVLVDAGARLDDVTVALGASAGRMLLVTTPDRVAVAATYALLKIISERLGHIATEVVINRCDDASGAAAFAALRAGAERFLGRTVSHAACMPDDADMQQHIEAGALLAGAAGCKAFRSIEPLALHLMAPRLSVTSRTHLP